MCTLALYFREFENYPLVVAANRDEHFSRPSAPPQVLLDEPTVFGGKDLVAGGTWLGINTHGLIAGIVNRRVETPKAMTTPRSRGLLCLDMLRAKDVAQAREWLWQENGSRYQPFILLVASSEASFAAYNSGSGIRQIELETGLHVFSNTSFCEPDSGKLSHAHQLFSAAITPLRKQLDGSAAETFSSVETLQGILSDHEPAGNSKDPRDAICVHTPDYGTVSSTILFHARFEKRFHFHHAPAPPCRGLYGAAHSREIL